MDKYRRHCKWLVAAYLVICCAPDWVYGQGVSARATNAVLYPSGNGSNPTNLTLIGASGSPLGFQKSGNVWIGEPNGWTGGVEFDTGSSSASLGNNTGLGFIIQGTGNGLFTGTNLVDSGNMIAAAYVNPVFITSSNSSQGVLIVTNDPSNNYNDARSVNLEFTGASDTNTPQITFSGTNPTSPGPVYAQILENPNHDGGTSDPRKGELEIISANNIMFGPGVIGNNTGGQRHIQIGFNGTAFTAYFNLASNLNTMLGTGSSLLQFRQQMLTNGNTFEFDPGLASLPMTSNKMEGHFVLYHDTQQGNANFGVGVADINRAIVGLDAYIGTNSSGTFYTGVDLLGRNGTTTNAVRVNTNGVTVNGNLTGDTGSTWQGPTSGTFQCGVGNANVFFQGSFAWFGTGGNNVDFRIGATTGTPATDYFLSGGAWGGNSMPIGSLAIGPNSNRTVTNANDQLEVFGTVVIPTNRATVFTITNPIISGGTWTNTTGANGIWFANYTLTDSTVSGDPGLNFTNLDSGEFFSATNAFVLSAPGTGRTSFRVANGERITVTNQSSGSASATLNTNWFRGSL